MIDPEILENFERSFHSSLSSCRVDCKCGKTFFHDDDSYSWGLDEFEKLHSLTTEGKAVACDYTPGILSIDGGYYADGCDCWHPLAVRIIAFINDNAGHIAEFLKLEKERKERIAKTAVTFTP